MNKEEKSFRIALFYQLVTGLKERTKNISLKRFIKFPERVYKEIQEQIKNEEREEAFSR